MKAVLFEKPHILNVVERPLRKLQPGEVLVRVDACGLCGTDVHIVEGTSRSTPPVVLGHEYAGRVEDAVGDTGGLIPGTHVAVDPNCACGRCFYCRRGLVHLCGNLRALGVDIDGGMAEYSIVPANQAFAMPAAMPPEASAFIEPVSCALHGIDKARIAAGDTVVLLGGGTIGLILLQLVRHAGAARILLVEPLAHKRALAAALGADMTIDPVSTDVPAAVMDLTKVGADVVIECAGTVQTAALAIELARRGGTVEFFGVCPIGRTIPVEPNRVYFKELTIVGSYVNPHTFSRSIEVMANGIVDVAPLKPDSFPLDGIHEALRLQREGATIKSILRPHR